MQDMGDEYYSYLNTIDRIDEEKNAQQIRDCEFNRMLGVCGSYYATVFRNYRNSYLSTIKKCAKALNVDCRYLLEGTPKKEYKDVEFNLKNLTDFLYRKRLYTDSSTRAILTYIRQGRQDKIRLSTYHRLNNITQGKLYSILTGEN